MLPRSRPIGQVVARIDAATGVGQIDAVVAADHDVVAATADGVPGLDDDPSRVVGITAHVEPAIHPPAAVEALQAEPLSGPVDHGGQVLVGQELAAVEPRSHQALELTTLVDRLPAAATTSVGVRWRRVGRAGTQGGHGCSSSYGSAPAPTWNQLWNVPPSSPFPDGSTPPM